MVKKIFYGLAVLFVIIQFIRPSHNIGEIYSENHISKVKTVPSEVDAIFKKACYDCHSNNTTYPWYDKIQPVAWMLEHHVVDGKKHLNFSEFAKYDAEKQHKKLQEITEAIDEGWMPISGYTFIHKEANLTDAEKKLLIEWAKASM